MNADIAGIRRRARALLPAEVYDYYAGGALAHPAGEVAAAEGAARAGALFVLSARSARTIEDAADTVARSGGTWWYRPVDPSAAEQAADLGPAGIGWLAGLGEGIPVPVAPRTPRRDASAVAAYRVTVRVSPKLRGEDAHLVTEARRSRSEDIAYRERRYLIMMTVRVICFGLAVVLFTQGAGWVAAIPAAGAIILPYIAVVFANGGREPAKTQVFREYTPRLPAVSSGPRTGPPDGHPGQATPPAPADAGPEADTSSSHPGASGTSAPGAGRGAAARAATPPSSSGATPPSSDT